MNKEAIKQFLELHDEVEELAIKFAESKGLHPGRMRGCVSFEDEGVWVECNDSCHCHPEWYPKFVGSGDDFIEWLSENNKLTDDEEVLE